MLEQLTSLIETAEGDEKTISIAIISIIVFFRLITLIWTARDISARTENHFFQIISILLVTFLTPIIGLPLYLAIRPVGQIIRTNGSLKVKPSGIRENFIVQNNTRCQKCGTLNPKEYKNCIQCGEKIRIKCKECDNEYPHNYSYCPNCGAPNIEH